MTLPYAEEMNYWKTSKSSAASWLEKASVFLTGHGAEVHVTAKGSQGDNAAYLIEFSFPPDRFRCIWPVLSSKLGNVKAAERQAATMLFHDIKSRALRFAIQGPRGAFIDFLMLPNGQTVAQSTNENIAEVTRLLPPPPSV